MPLLPMVSWVQPSATWFPAASAAASTAWPTSRDISPVALAAQDIGLAGEQLPGAGDQALAMTASFGSTRTASSGPTWRSDDALIWPHPGLPRSPIVAGAHRTSRSYVLAAPRALHLDLRLVASDQAAVEETGTPGRQLTASAGEAISSRHRTCPFWDGATSSRPGGANSSRPNQGPPRQPARWPAAGPDARPGASPASPHPRPVARAARPARAGRP